MKICQECYQENKSNYTDLCRVCYNKHWFANLSPRNCVTCSREYKGFGKNCATCARKLREKKNPKPLCSSCLRTSVKIKSQELRLCGRCFRKKKEQDDPAYREKRILYNRRMHRVYRGQDPDAPLQRNPAGSGYVNVDGYRVITVHNHPNCLSSKGAILEHTYVMSQHLGRSITKSESVHHKNGFRSDNRLENLELWHRGQPPGQRLEDKIDWAKKFLEEYGYVIQDGGCHT